MFARSLILMSVLGAACAIAQADQVIFKNGDKITGKVETLDGGKLKITSAVAGTITVDLKDVATFSTEAPIDIRTADGKKLNEKVAAGETDQVKGDDGQPIPLAGITKINPPPEVWSGAVVINGSLTRGNTDTDNLGVAVNAGLRRNNDTNNDRFTVGGAYNFGRQKDSVSGNKVTSTDNWMAMGKYDLFLTPKFYAFGLMQVDHDRIADLNYRLSPSVGVGYQWIEKPDMNFSTEAGAGYVYEKYISGGTTDDYVALRLAYHFDKKLSETVAIFHNLAWMPAIDDPSNFNLDTDAGIRANLTKNMFSQLKVEWKRNTRPAPGAQEDDLIYTLGVGWTF